jgi:HEAT repeat protein
LAALADKDPDVRVEAVGTVGYLKDRTSLAALIAAAGDAEPRVRRASVGALIFVRDEAVVTTVLQRLSDADWSVREAAAEAASFLSEQPAVGAALIAVLDDEYWQVRLKATRGLGRLKVRASLRKIASQLDHAEANLRKESATALGEIGDASVVPFLEPALNDPDPDVRKTARWALSRLTE